MNKINATIVADSICNKNRITSMILTIPQIVVKELLRHRMFSFSSSSMRAIPFKKVIGDIKENMFVPLAFQQHHSGMQGDSYLTDTEFENAKQQWISSGIKACEEAEKLYNLGVTKQLCSRIIEPFGYAKILVTATEYDGFFELRCPKYKLFGLGGNPQKSRKDWLKHMQFSSSLHPSQYPKTEEEWWSISESSAEIHIQALAEAMWDAMNESIPNQLKSGDWHIPFGDSIDYKRLGEITSYYYQNNPNEIVDINKWTTKIATARCARLSYMTFDNEIDYEKDIKLHDQLLESGHFSPFEHCARAMSDEEYYSFLKGELKTKIVNSFNERRTNVIDKNSSVFGWCNNFRGFIQYRYLIENNKN